jgi:hypothetical protein
MSLSLGMEGQTAADVIAACDRLSGRLPELMAELEQGASIAREDWSGPHRDTFEDRYACAVRALIAGGYWVMRLRHALLSRLDELVVEAQAAAAELQTTGPR